MHSPPARPAPTRTRSPGSSSTGRTAEARPLSAEHNELRAPAPCRGCGSGARMRSGGRSGRGQGRGGARWGGGEGRAFGAAGLRVSARRLASRARCGSGASEGGLLLAKCRRLPCPRPTVGAGGGAVRTDRDGKRGAAGAAPRREGARPPVGGTAAPRLGVKRGLCRWAGLALARSGSLRASLP